MALKRIRVTRGKYLGEFQIIDDYSMPANAKRMLEASWSGTTKFRQAAEYKEDVVDVGIDDDGQKQNIAQSDLDEKIDEEHEPAFEPT